VEGCGWETHDSNSLEQQGELGAHLAVHAVGEPAVVRAVTLFWTQSGSHAADSILRDLNKQQRTRFVYRDKGQMATIGRSRAIVKTNRLTLTGRFAWLAWLFVHVWNLVGFRNRATVVFQWAWNYLFSRRESRLITGGLVREEG